MRMRVNQISSQRLSRDAKAGPFCAAPFQNVKPVAAMRSPSEKIDQAGSTNIVTQTTRMRRRTFSGEPQGTGRGEPAKIGTRAAKVMLFRATLGYVKRFRRIPDRSMFPNVAQTWRDQLPEFAERECTRLEKILRRLTSHRLPRREVVWAPPCKELDR